MRFLKTAAAIAAAGALAMPGIPARASSHSDAPLIKLDPQANLTDVYAFIRTPGGQKTLNIVVNVRPFINPGDGVTYDKFADDALYSIHIADPATGATRARYDFRFSPVNTNFKNPNTILSCGLGTEAGGIQHVGDARQNYTQTYTVTRVRGSSSTLLNGNKTLVVPPSNVGPRTTPFYNNTDESSPEYGKAIDAGSGYSENLAWCHAQLALIYFSNGNLLAAEKTLEQAMKHSSKNYHVLATMGRVRSARKDYKAAIDYYQRAVAIAPQHDALVALGDLFLLTGNPAEAEKQFSLLESIHKINKANGVKGDAQMAMFYAGHDRNLKEALVMAETEFKTRKNVAVADTLAWCSYKNGKYEEAKQAIRTALSHKTPEAAYLYHAGMIYAKLGQPETAKQYLSRALSLNPGWNPVGSQAAVEMLAQLGGSGPEWKRIAEK